MRDPRAIANLAFDGFTVLCWAFVAYVVLRRFGFQEASPILAGTLGFVAFAALIGDWIRDQRRLSLMLGKCAQCHGVDISTFHRCRAYESASGRWQEPVTEWSCRTCGYEYSEGASCPQCPDRPGFWPR